MLHRIRLACVCAVEKQSESFIFYMSLVTSAQLMLSEAGQQYRILHLIVPLNQMAPPDLTGACNHCPGFPGARHAWQAGPQQ